MKDQKSISEYIEDNNDLSFKVLLLKRKIRRLEDALEDDQP